MSKIKVLSSTRGHTDIDAVSSAERKYLFEKLAQHLKQIPRAHFDSFIESREQMLRHVELTTRPKLRELMIRRVIDLCHYLFELKSPVVVPDVIIATRGHILIPVIAEVLVKNIFVKKSDASRKYSRSKSHTKSYRGGDGTTSNQILFKEAIRSRFDKPTRAVTPAGINMVIAPDEEVVVIGLATVRADVTVMKDIIPNGNYRPSVLIDQYLNMEKQKQLTDESMSVIFDNLVQSVEWLMSPGAARSMFDKLSIERPSSVIEQFDEYVNDTSTPDIRSMLKMLEFKETKLNFTINHTYKMTYLEAMYSIGLLGDKFISTVIAIHGIDSADVKQMVETRKQRVIDHEHAIATARIANENLFMENSLLRIIEEKLGTKRLNEVTDKLASSTLRGKDILDVVSAGEKKMIFGVYTNALKHNLDAMTNKCPHVRVSKMFRNAKSDDDRRKLFKQLKTFFGSSSKKLKFTHDDYIKCKLCQFDIICPHIVKLTELQLANADYKTIKGAMSIYINKIQHQTNYYCAICSEVLDGIELYSESVADIESKLYSSISDELRTMMWAEISGVHRYISYSTVVNSNKLVAAILAGIYPYVFEIEKQLLKTKTNTADDVKNKKKLFINIYAYAYVINLIFSNRKHNVIDFKNIKEVLKKKTQPKTVSEYIKYAIMMIVKTRNSIIYQIVNISNEFIKNKIIDAFKLISSQGPNVITLSDQAEDTYDILMLDSIYDYLYYMYNIDKKRVAKSPHDKMKQIENIMGANVNKLNKQRNGIFGSIRSPDYKKYPIAKFRACPDVYVSGKLKLITGDQYSEIYRGYIADGYRLFEEYLTTGLHSLDVYVDDNGGSIMNPRLQAYHDKCAEFASAERLMRKHRQMSVIKNSVIFDDSNFARGFTYTRVPLGEVYDLDGNLHNFINDKCTVCSITRSKASQLDENKIRAVLAHIYTVENFYTYYRNRCPKSHLHEWVKSGKTFECTKCKMRFNMFKTLDEKFYDSYKKKFTSDMNDDITDTDSDAAVVRTQTPIDKKIIEKYNKYTFDFNKLLKLSSMVRVNNNAMMALASVENVEYSTITDGTFVPPEPDSNDDHRIYMLDAIIVGILTDYNRLRYYSSTIKPSDDLRKIVESSNIRKFQLQRLPEVLAEVYLDFDERLRYFKKNKKPRVVVEFLLESIGDLCMTIRKQKNTSDINVDDLLDKFIKYVVGKFMKADEMKSKPGPINWGLFRKEKAAAIEADQHVISDEPATEVVEDANADTDDPEHMQVSPFANQLDVGDNGELDGDDDYDIKIQD